MSSGSATNEAAVAEVAQSVRTEGQTGFTHYPHQIDLLEKGTYDNVYLLPEITVPANEWFNYRLLLVAQTRLRNRDDVQITSSKADFLSTLEVVGLIIKDSAGNPVDFRIDAASGALYTANGINAVPEPASMALVGIAGAVMFLMRRRIR